MFQVTEDEVVRHWNWNELSHIDGWYELIVLPAFKKHERKYEKALRREKEYEEGKEAEVASLMDKLCRMSCSTVTRSTSLLTLRSSFHQHGRKED